MKKKPEATIKKAYCKACKVDVVPIEKIFHTLLCPRCSVILSSDCGIDKS